MNAVHLKFRCGFVVAALTRLCMLVALLALRVAFSSDAVEGRFWGAGTTASAVASLEINAVPTAESHARTASVPTCAGYF